MRSKQFFLALSLAGMAPIAAATAQAPTTFTARIEAAICPEQQYQLMQYVARYRVAGVSQVFTAPIVSQTIDTPTATGTFEIELPATYGTADLSVTLECVNSFGPSGESVPAQISNCDALSVVDVDSDGLTDDLEDTDCNGYFTIADRSNPQMADTDGDGIFDVTEVIYGFDPASPGSSPFPRILKGAPADFDNDGDANAVVWRPEYGAWLVKDYGAPGNTLVQQWGLPGDAPFAYQPDPSLQTTTDFGVVRRTAQQSFTWYFHGPGFRLSNGQLLSTLSFGMFGDYLLPGPWESPGITNPAIARFYNGYWFFHVYLRDGTIRSVPWGVTGDHPKVADYDGDGLFDAAVFRPSELKTYVLRSSDGNVQVLEFGTATADFTPAGDYTGDGIADLVFWEPINGMFFAASSEAGFDASSSFGMQLGLLGVHLPLSYNRKAGVDYFTVVDHTLGL
ncbi:MAG: VCBS repeat-containing protein, partial [Bdellovibrionales bacterium]|nr:VCBS repeat-containing protein [Bdellovibrionales bacterium]